MLRGLAKKQTILKVVEENPGVGFLDIHNITGFGHGVVSHHLAMLEKDGSVRINRGKRKIWIFESDLDPAEDNIRIALRKETCKKILVFLLDVNHANFVQISNAINKSTGTTSVTLKKLIEHKVIKVVYGFPKKYTLENFEKTAHLLDGMTLSHTDELKDRFADTFSYF